MSRGYAFSSRSSASEPATRSTVTNISVTVAATEIAKASSEVPPPATTVFSTSMGDATAPSSGTAKSRLSPASSANSITSWTSSADFEPGGSSFSTWARMSAALSRPRMSNESPSSGIEKLPPSTRMLR